MSAVPKPIKVLLVMPYFYPHKGGSQKYAEELYSTLIELYPKTYQVDVIAYNTDSAPQFEVYKNLNIYRIPCWQIIKARFCLPNPIALTHLLRQLSVNKYNYVNSQLIFFDPCWWLWSYGHHIGAKTIFTEHVASYPVHQSSLVMFISKFIDKTIGKWAASHYDLITVTNQAASKFLHQIGIKKPTNLVYGGVNTEFFQPGHATNTITFVGRIIWTKGVTYLYSAIKNILPKIPVSYNFIFAGGGELENQLKSQIKNDRLENRISVTGFIPYEQVRDILKTTSIFITPSHHNEGFPNTILEAGASGNFVIATDNAGTNEVIENKITGLLIPQKDQPAIENSLLWAINNPQKRQKNATNLHKRIKKEFDWKIIAKNFHQLLQDNL